MKKNNRWYKWRKKHWFLCYNIALAIALLIVVMIIVFMNIFGTFIGVLYSMLIIGCMDIIMIYLTKKYRC